MMMVFVPVIHAENSHSCVTRNKNGNFSTYRDIEGAALSHGDKEEGMMMVVVIDEDDDHEEDHLFNSHLFRISRHHWVINQTSRR